MCLLCVVCFFFFLCGVCCWLLGFSRLLSVVCCLLFVVCKCLLFVGVCCLLCGPLVAWLCDCLVVCCV